jgi:hypothetical protein
MNESISKEFLDRFQNIKYELLRATANSILKSTIQFFCDDQRGRPAPTASGLLISIDNRYFMLTAAHVIAEDYNNTFIILPEKELQLGGLLHFTPLPKSGKRADDKIDIAVMELEESVVTDIQKSFDFITLANIGIGHKGVDLPYYYSVGYPASKTKKVWGKDEISAIPFPYQTEIAVDFNYAKWGFSPKSHIHKAPSLSGISGSGLWFLQDFAHPQMINTKKLIGLVIEQKNKGVNNQGIIATRIDLVTEFLRQHFHLNIPKSSTIKVNNLKRPPV